MIRKNLIYSTMLYFSVSFTFTKVLENCAVLCSTDFTLSTCNARQFNLSWTGLPVKKLKGYIDAFFC